MRGKKLPSLLLALAAVLALTVSGAAAASALPGGDGDLNGKIVILHTNDTHGADAAGDGVLGMASAAQLKADYEARGTYVLLVDAGDAIQGTTLVSLSQGAAAIDFMNAAGYDAAVPGNHEFDYGYENLTALAGQAQFPYLAANIFYNGQPAFAANTVFTAPDGTKIGLFGLDTPEAQTKTHPDKIRGVEFLAGEELFACAQAQVDELTAAGCDLIVCVGHLGVDEESEGNRSTDLLAAVDGIDLFIDGHSHTVLDGSDPENQINGAMLVSTGSSFANIGVVLYDGQSLTPALLSADDYDRVDPEVNRLVSQVADQVEQALSAVFAETTVRLNGDRDPGNRTQETNLGDFAADAILWSARQSCGEQVAAAITNGGGIRASIEVGDISMNDMKTVFPFGNQVTVFTVTGAQLLEALEMATYCTPTALGAFPQVAGIEFTLNTAMPYVKGEAYGTYFRCADPGQRVTNVTVGGRPLDLTASYVIASNDFTAAGGDTYYPFTLATDVYQTGVSLEEALVQYTQQELGGVIGSDYAQPQGRIRIVSLPVDVAADAWYGEAVTYVYENSLMTGVGGGRFHPDGSVTRGQVYQVLYNAAGRPEVSGPSPFSDTAGKWYEDAAIWAQSTGLTNGSGGGRFSGDRAMTRQELAKALVSYVLTLNVLPSDYVDLSTYPDAAAVADWAYDYMTYAVSLDLMGGIYGRLEPSGTASRAQLAQVLLNMSALEPSFTETPVSLPVAASRDVEAHDVPGVLTMPAEPAGDVPAVVLLHDLSGDKDSAAYLLAASHLAAHGIASLRIDFMGFGDSTANTRDYHYASALADARAAADYLAGLEGIDADAIGVLGWGQGGAVALMAAGQYDGFRSVVTWAAAPDLTGLFSDRDYETARQKGWFTLEADWLPHSLRLSRQWCDDVREVSVLNRFAPSDAPVLAIQGQADTVVEPGWAQQIADASSNPNSAVYLIPDCDHLLNLGAGGSAAVSDAVYTTIEFFLDTLK